MRDEFKISTVWATAILASSIFLLLPHREIDPLGLVNASLQLLLCIFSIFIAKRCSGNQKFIYINFAVFFGFVAPMLLNTFIGYGFLNNTSDISVYYRLYINKMGADLLLVFTPLFVIVDYLFPPQPTLVKYSTTFCVTACLIVYWLGPFLISPSNLYREEDYLTFQKMGKFHREFVHEKHREPTSLEFVQDLTGKNSSKNEHQQELNSIFNTVHRLSPYLKEGGITAVFWKPINLISMYANGTSFGLIVLFLILSYKLDKPYHAYVDKNLIPFFAFSVLDVFHNYGYIQSHSTENFLMIFRIGQYFTITCLLALVFVFDLNLRFVTSPTGEYYEHALKHSAQNITRWRDEIDNLIIKIFAKGASQVKQLGYK